MFGFSKVSLIHRLHYQFLLCFKSINVKVCIDVCSVLFYAKTTERISMKIGKLVVYNQV